MATITVKCKYCGSENVIFKGTQSGKQRCGCNDCKRSFQLSYTYKAYESGVKSKIMPMAHNGSGIRDTARVLGISKTTVMSHIKKKR